MQIKKEFEGGHIYDRRFGKISIEEKNVPVLMSLGHFHVLEAPKKAVIKEIEVTEEQSKKTTKKTKKKDDSSSESNSK